MPLPPQKFREATLQMLYCWDYKTDIDEMVSLIMATLKTTKRSTLSALARVKQIVDRKDVIDSLIQNVSTEYRFERISRVERAILRLGSYELLYEGKIPPKVVFQEAIRLARKFGTPESAQFVNAILDGIFKVNEAQSSTKSQFI